MPFFLFLFFLLMVAYAVLIAWYHRAWNQVPEFINPGNKPVTFISVIIPARNEEKNIPALLDSLCGQDYPKTLFEVIIIDDHSTDATWQLLQQNTCNNLLLKPLRLREQEPGFISFKKKSIETGIASAQGQLIVTTDADCRFQPQWLSTIAGFYEARQAKFIAAPVAMKNTNSPLSIFQSLDFLTLQGITAASVYKRFHSMCNGANLAYEKAAFEAVNGFQHIDGLPTGDDMLLMHKIYTRYPDKVFYLKSKPAMVVTEPMPTWKDFFHQRIRWASKADHYDDKRIFRVLLLVYLLNACFLVTAVASFWKNIWLFFLVLLLIAKILIEFPFVNTVAAFFGRQKLMKYFPFFEPLHILYTLIAGWLGKFGGYEWKGRRIKRSK
jgi:cellulose synthase/poly-beta-1,6-N-acetylglucosamine synthase-like glycosyltransferase